MIQGWCASDRFMPPPYTPILFFLSRPSIWANASGPKSPEWLLARPTASKWRLRYFRARGWTRNTLGLSSSGLPTVATTHSRLPMRMSAPANRLAKAAKGSRPLRMASMGPSSNIMSPTMTMVSGPSAGGLRTADGLVRALSAAKLAGASPSESAASMSAAKSARAFMAPPRPKHIGIAALCPKAASRARRARSAHRARAGATRRAAKSGCAA